MMRVAKQNLQHLFLIEGVYSYMFLQPLFSTPVF